MNIFDDISCIKGVGPKTKTNINKCMIFNIKDLLLYFPRDYEVINGESAGRNIVFCKVLKIDKDVRTKTSKIITTIIFDCEGKKIKGKWFNQPYIKNNFRVGNEYRLLGKITEYNGDTVITNPVILSANSPYYTNNGKKSIVPKYPLKSGITNRLLMKLIKDSLNQVHVDENIPEWILKKHSLCPINEALNNIHFPKSFSHLSKAVERLKFQELFVFSLKIIVLREFRKIKRQGIAFKISKALNDVIPMLSYDLTRAQRKVLREILKDQKSLQPMNRLLQGDVGSGKTIVALISVLNVVKNGYQAVLMAPTEILAAQHYNEAETFLTHFGVKIGLLCGSTPQKNKEIIKKKIKNGEIDFVIGTHAVLEKDVEFANLGFVIADEQHRFGVVQRNRLINKDKCVDTLVMTATPIPRTLSLILYGDLDVSIIDELPPGRKKVDTFIFDNNNRAGAYKFALNEIKNGRQVYVVCPSIEENDSFEINSIESLYEELKNSFFKGLNIAVLHGKMSGKSKETIMAEFKENKTNVLISTTVVEVGVNVPNASVMIIENAERFGLAQLHQLRGRVGRGNYQSYCMLISSAKNELAVKRLNILKNCSNGFIIAEEDLKLRGGGEVFGNRQSGESGFLIADVINDMKIFRKAYNSAEEFLKSKNMQDMKLQHELIDKIENEFGYMCFN